MSTAYYPMGMNSYNNRSSASGAYKSWKGSKPFNNPVGVTSGNIRPQTNKDYTNNVEYKPGLARPIKHYRRGIVVSTMDETQSGDTRNVKSASRNLPMVRLLMDTPGGYQIHTDNNTSCDATCPGTSVISSWQPTTNITIKPEVPSSLRLTAHGYNKTTRTSRTKKTRA